ncbi:MAG: PEP-CTERM sorting domain-containing protein [Planctomycetota bacterium]
MGGGSTVRDFTIVPTAIPEPSSFAVCGLVLAGLVTRRRKNIS